MSKNILVYVRHSDLTEAPLTGGFCLVATNKGKAEKKFYESVLLSPEASPEEALVQSTIEALKQIRQTDRHACYCPS